MADQHHHVRFRRQPHHDVEQTAYRGLVDLIPVADLRRVGPVRAEDRGGRFASSPGRRADQQVRAADRLAQPGNEEVRSVNALVGETNDGGLNDIRGLHVTRDHVLDAIRTAKAGPVAEGAVGAGTGTICYGWKGGIGTSSRHLERLGYTVGVLAQTNFGGNLTIAGVPIFKTLQPPSRRAAAGDDLFAIDGTRRATADGSCMLVVATDAPLDARDLGRLAARAVFGLARTGSFMDNGSGDFVIAFSTKNLVEHEPKGRTATVEAVTNDSTSPLFLAAVEAVEEAVVNSLTRATSVTGFRGRKVEALPIDRLRELLAKRPAPPSR